MRGAGLALGDDSVQRIASIPTPLSLLAAKASGVYCGVGTGEVERPTWFAPVVGRENPA